MAPSDRHKNTDVMPTTKKNQSLLCKYFFIYKWCFALSKNKTMASEKESVSFWRNFRHCMHRKLSKWQFPAATGENVVKMTFPFHFLTTAGTASEKCQNDNITVSVLQMTIFFCCRWPVSKWKRHSSNKIPTPTHVHLPCLRNIRTSSTTSQWLFTWQRRLLRARKTRPYVLTQRASRTVRCRCQTRTSGDQCHCQAGRRTAWSTARRPLIGTAQISI